MILKFRNIGLEPGKYVKIKSEYDPGAVATSYRRFFTEIMLKEHGGQYLKIIRRIYIKESNQTLIPDEPDDGFIYDLDTEVGWKWTSSMFDV